MVMIEEHINKLERRRNNTFTFFLVQVIILVVTFSYHFQLDLRAINQSVCPLITLNMCTLTKTLAQDKMNKAGELK